MIRKNPFLEAKEKNIQKKAVNSPNKKNKIKFSDLVNKNSGIIKKTEANISDNIGSGRREGSLASRFSLEPKNQLKDPIVSSKIPGYLNINEDNQFFEYRNTKEECKCTERISSGPQNRIKLPNSSEDWIMNENITAFINKHYEPENIEFNDEMEEQMERLNAFKLDDSGPRKPLINDSIDEKIKEIRSLLKSNQVILVKGDTGCGKTTKIPRCLMDEYTNIVCTQPRRLAAINVAKKVSMDLKTKLGNEIGYSVRFDNCTSNKTKLRYVTDGTLILDLVGKISRKVKYDLIIIDEAHERSINIDFLLGYFKSLIDAKRFHSKLMIMSATLDISKLIDFFNCPVVDIKLKMYEIQYFYLLKSTDDYFNGCINTIIDVIYSYDSGDILVFLAGSSEIENAYNILSEILMSSNLQILKLYSAISPEDQNLIYSNFNKRKVILSTNICETSVTIENIKFVIDSGKIKIKNWCNKSSVESLAVSNISQAQANQRAGRSGRIGRGIVYRIYTKDDYNSFDKNPIPEILRSNLCSSILTLKSLRINDVLGFNFIDKPDEETFLNSLQMLYYLKAIDHNSIITNLGIKLSKMPVPLEIGISILMAKKLGCLEKIVIISSFLSFNDVFINIKPGNPKFKEFREAVKSFAHEKGNLYTFLQIYKSWKAKKFSESFLKRHYLNRATMHQILNIRAQLLAFFPKCKDTSDKIEMSLCAGFFMNIAKKSENGYVTLFGDVKCNISTKDSLYKKKPTLILFCECIRFDKTNNLINCLEIDQKTLNSAVNELTYD